MNIPRDLYYEALLDRTSALECGLADGHPVFIWDGRNNTLVSQEFLEDLDTDLEEIERLPGNAYRFGQYRLDYVTTHKMYGVIEFEISHLPADIMGAAYWQRLNRWLDNQGKA